MIKIFRNIFKRKPPYILEEPEIIKKQDEKKGLIQYVKIERSLDTEDANVACIKTIKTAWFKSEVYFEEASNKSFSFQFALLPKGTRSNEHVTRKKHLDGFFDDGTRYGSKTLYFSDDSIFTIQYNFFGLFSRIMTKILHF